MPPFRKIAPITAPASDPMPPTTAAVNTATLCSAVKGVSVYCWLIIVRRHPATPARKPEIANEVSFARTTRMP